MNGRAEVQAAPCVSAESFRGAMACLASGVTVISTRDAQGAPHGVTVSSFVSLSLDPPLIQWSLRRTAPSYAVFSEARHFAANILAADQEEVSRRFCAPVDRFAALRAATGMADVPLVPGALAWIECERVDEFPGGDHAIFLGRVMRARHRDRPPLVHWRGGYHNIA